jgi:hypothetical protein
MSTAQAKLHVTQLSTTEDLSSTVALKGGDHTPFLGYEGPGKARKNTLAYTLNMFYFKGQFRYNYAMIVDEVEFSR